jgi:hypothetical protein
MSKVGIKIDEIKTKLLKDDEFKEEYNKLKPKYDNISRIIESRKIKNNSVI